MARLHENRLGSALCEALGLDPKQIAAITIHCDIHFPATVDVVRYVEGVEADRLEQVVSRYRLVEDE